jgi:hypothetical protein
MWKIDQSNRKPASTPRHGGQAALTDTDHFHCKMALALGLGGQDALTESEVTLSEVEG